MFLHYINLIVLASTAARVNKLKCVAPNRRYSLHPAGNFPCAYICLILFSLTFLSPLFVLFIPLSHHLGFKIFSAMLCIEIPPFASFFFPRLLFVNNFILSKVYLVKSVQNPAVSYKVASHLFDSD